MICSFLLLGIHYENENICFEYNIKILVNTSLMNGLKKIHPLVWGFQGHGIYNCYNVWYKPHHPFPTLHDFEIDFSSNDIFCGNNFIADFLISH